MRNMNYLVNIAYLLFYMPFRNIELFAFKFVFSFQNNIITIFHSGDKSN